MNNQLNIFQPLLEAFCDGFDKSKIDINIPNIFLPHTMSEYSKTPKKIFYIGQDTNGWGNITELFDDYYSGIGLSDYIETYSEWLRNFTFLDSNNNGAYKFWTLVIRLHLRLKGVNEKISISKDIPAKYKHLFNDFGWGNTNSLEIIQTEQNRKVWRKINYSKYKYTKERTSVFDQLKLIINAFSPSLIFIFNWDCDENMYLKGLEIEYEEKVDLVNQHYSIYKFKDLDTKVIWTIHPNNLRFMGMTIDELVDSIIKQLSL